jgi:galactokinase
MIPDIRAGFQNEFGCPAEVAARAPGRLEILGNHTDYNEGVVLSVAVDRETRFAARRVPGSRCEVRDLRSGDHCTFDVDRLGKPKPGDWANYIKGILVQLQKRGVTVPAFNAVLESTIPMSAGMSSSAALEMAVGLALGDLAGADLPWLEWAKIGQACENEYVGAHTGLLDQFSSLRGRAGQLVF